jgi:YHYH protein
MKLNSFQRRDAKPPRTLKLTRCGAALFFAMAASSHPVQADPILTSWFTTNSGMLARVIQNNTTQTAALTTRPSAGIANNNTGGAAQTLPAYADMQRISYTATDVYINANGLASHTMGPWFTSGGGLFGFWPLARDYSTRLTRNPAVAGTKTRHPGGTTTYGLGRYCGDYDYLGDLGLTQGTGFDLDTYNGRNCVTPEFPGGTYAYFVSTDASGGTVFPHMLGKQYYGTPNAASNATIPGGATVLFNGGPNLTETWSGSPAVNPANGNVTLTWSSVEGGSYQVEATTNLATWTPLAPSVPAAAQATQTSTTENGAALPGNNTKRFYRVTRSGLAPFDPAYPGQ